MNCSIICLPIFFSVQLIFIRTGYIPTVRDRKSGMAFEFSERLEMDNPWQLCWTIGPLTLHSQEINIQVLSDSGFADSYIVMLEMHLG